MKDGQHTTGSSDLNVREANLLTAIQQLYYAPGASLLVLLD
jgi:hypothetical protein